MTYASQSEIELAAGGAARLVEIADIDGDGVADAAVIADAQQRADGWIDGYLRLRFATPIATPSATLKAIAADEAVYRLKASRGMLALTQADLDQRKDRIRELEQMEQGRLRPDEPNPAKSTAVKSAIVENDSDFTRESLKGQW